MQIALVVDDRNLGETDNVEYLAPALKRLGCRVDIVSWEASGTTDAGDVAYVLRATWNYHLKPAAFLRWAHQVGESATLINAYDTVRWNAEKTYLLDLEQRGVAIVPTVYLKRGQTVDLGRVADEHGWQDVVVKPAVSASAHQTELVRLGERERGQALLDRLVFEQAALVQSFLPTVTTELERSLVFFNGTFSHAISQPPSLGSGSGVGEPGVVTAGDDEVEFARFVLAASGKSTVYARVDILRDPAGRLRLMELELIEPWLGLSLCQGAAERFARAICARV